jgi:O-methyltransferase
VLRLDGDFYDSTKICLETLYDQVVWGGIVIIDDYGVFPGCRRAVDEFIAARRLPVRLIYVDVAVHFFFKP